MDGIYFSRISIKARCLFFSFFISKIFLYFASTYNDNNGIYELEQINGQWLLINMGLQFASGWLVCVRACGWVESIGCDSNKSAIMIEMVIGHIDIYINVEHITTNISLVNGIVQAAFSPIESNAIRR